MPKAVIFDIDGTIIDSVDSHANAWQEAFKQFGYEIAFDRVRSQIGKGGDQLLPEFLNGEELERDSKNIEEFRAERFKEKYLPHLKAFPGVRELFEKVRTSGQKIALASSAKGEELKHYEKIAQIDDLVEIETSSSDAKRSKPHPDIFEAAIGRLSKGIVKEDILVVGDSPHDAEAAKRASLKTVGVLCGGFPAKALQEAGCIAIFEGPADLLKHFDRSPLVSAARVGRER